MRLALPLALCAALLATTASAQDERATPYWASISSGQAMMRTGPGKTYPGTWLYQRRNLPVKVTQRYDNWRKIVDPDGAEGWMAVALLSDTRTGMVTSDIPAPLRVGASLDSPVRYRAEPGVVGELDQCNGKTCLMRVGDREGWIAQDALWGVDAGERFD